MDTKNLSLWAAVLLLVGGLVHLIPALYTGLANLTGGTPWVQIVVGILSVIVALVMFAGEKQDTDDGTPPSPTTTTGTGNDTSMGGPV